MLYARIASNELEQLTQEMKAAGDARWYRRLKVVHLSSQGAPVSQLAKTFDLCQATVRDYIKKYNQNGLQGLQWDTSNGAPEKISLKKKEWLILLTQRPTHFKKLRTRQKRWTQELLVDYFQVYHGITVTQQAISACLKRQGIRWDRAHQLTLQG